MMEGKKKFGEEINKFFDYTMFSYRMSFESNLIGAASIESRSVFIIEPQQYFKPLKVQFDCFTTSCMASMN